MPWLKNVELEKIQKEYQKLFYPKQSLKYGAYYKYNKSFFIETKKQKNINKLLQKLSKLHLKKINNHSEIILVQINILNIQNIKKYIFSLHIIIRKQFQRRQPNLEYIIQMQKPELVFEVSLEGGYFESKRHSNHPSIVIANKRMVQLNYSRCHEIYKGKSCFKNKEDQQFYNRSRSTPSKYDMQKSQSEASTRVWESHHQGSQNLEHSQISYQMVKSKYENQSNIATEDSRHFGSPFTRLEYQEAKKFQLPDHFKAKEEPQIKKERPNINNSFNMELIGIQGMLKNANLQNSVEVRQTIQSPDVRKKKQRIEGSHECAMLTPQTFANTTYKDSTSVSKTNLNQNKKDICINQLDFNQNFVYQTPRKPSKNQPQIPKSETFYRINPLNPKLQTPILKRTQDSPKELEIKQSHNSSTTRIKYQDYRKRSSSKQMVKKSIPVDNKSPTNTANQIFNKKLIENKNQTRTPTQPQTQNLKQPQTQTQTQPQIQTQTQPQIQRPIIYLNRIPNQSIKNTNQQNNTKNIIDNKKQIMNKNSVSTYNPNQNKISINIRQSNSYNQVVSNNTNSETSQIQLLRQQLEKKQMEIDNYQRKLFQSENKNKIFEEELNKLRKINKQEQYTKVIDLKTLKTEVRQKQQVRYYNEGNINWGRQLRHELTDGQIGSTNNSAIMLLTLFMVMFCKEIIIQNRNKL